MDLLKRRAGKWVVMHSEGAMVKSGNQKSGPGFPGIPGAVVFGLSRPSQRYSRLETSVLVQHEWSRTPL